MRGLGAEGGKELLPPHPVTCCPLPCCPFVPPGVSRSPGRPGPGLHCPQFWVLFFLKPSSHPPWSHRHSLGEPRGAGWDLGWACCDNPHSHHILPFLRPFTLQLGSDFLSTWQAAGGFTSSPKSWRPGLLQLGSLAGGGAHFKGLSVKHCSLPGTPASRAEADAGCSADRPSAGFTLGSL